jgi:glycosyltransferase involved in cell wall biosynthesis
MNARPPSKNERKKCGYFLYLAPREMASFVRRDYEILQGAYRMKTHFYRGNKGGVVDIPRILWGVLTSHFNISWFAYDQAYWAARFSRLLGRKCVVILGGFDVCEEEDPTLPARINRLQYILKSADALLAVSERVLSKTLALTGQTDNLSLLYHGFDSEKFCSTEPKLRRAVSVAFVSSLSIQRKGLDTLVEAARLLDDVSFCIVGSLVDSDAEGLRSTAPLNVQFTGSLDEPQLVKVLEEAAAYVQVSLHEGFGCALAEGMLCGCVPVVSNRGAIPEVVGECGVYVPVRNPAKLAEGIRRALSSPGLGNAARERVAKLFPIGKRKTGLLRVIDALLNQAKGGTA